MSLTQNGFGVREDRTVTEDSNIVPGGGSGAMPVWGQSRTEKLSKLIQAPYTNQSAYSLPTGVVDSHNEFGQSFPEGERTVQDSDDSGMRSGSSGDIMPVWNADRETQLSAFLTGPVYNNQSSFAIPSGVVGSGNWSYTYPNSERKIGISEPGVEVGYTYLGTRVSGTVLVSPNPDDENPDTYRLEGISLYTTDGVNEFTATADSTTGEYELPLSDGGEYEIEARHPALEPVTTTISAADGESVPDTDIIMPLDAGGGGGSAAGLVRRRIG